MKRFGLLLLVLTLGFMLIQCGGKEEQTASKAASTSDVETMASTSEQPAAMSYNLENGESIYKKYCFACHDPGIAGAAKHADLARWQESSEKGIPTLVQHVTEGYQGKYGVLPPKGTCMECSEQDIIDAVHYQLNMGGVLQ